MRTSSTADVLHEWYRSENPGERVSSVVSGGPSQRSDLRAAAPFAVLLLRRQALISSTAPAAHSTPSPAEADLARAVLLKALTVNDAPLAHLLDWARLAWQGPHLGSVFHSSGRIVLPPELHRTLSDLSAARPREPVMLHVVGSLALRSAADRLRALVGKHAAIDRNATVEFFTKPVDSLLEDIAAGNTPPPSLLHLSPEEHLARVNRSLPAPRSVPTNGSRWKALVKAAGEIAAHIDSLVKLAERFSWEAPALPSWDTLPLSGLAPDLLPLLAAALHPDPDPDHPLTDDGICLTTTVAATALTATPTRHRHRIAALLTGSGVPDSDIDRALEPLTRLRDRAHRLVEGVNLSDSDLLGPLHAMVSDALARGDIDEAEQGVELLSEAREQAELTERLDRCRRSPTPLGPEAELHLRTAERYLQEQELDLAARYLDLVERELLHSSPGPAASSQPGPSPAENTPSPAQELSAAVLAAYQAVRSGSADESQALAARADESLRRLADTGDHGAVYATARELVQLAPEAAVELIQRVVARLPVATRPMYWQLLESALRACGEDARADSVFRLGHPPLPPEDLPLRGPSPGSSGLRPFLRPLGGAASANPRLAGPVRAAEANDAEAAARGFIAASEAGNHIALGPAVGWSVLAGRPEDGLDLYRRVGARQYLNASAAWNITCAYAAVGATELALESLQVFSRLLPGRFSHEQRAAVEEFCAHHGVPSPITAAAWQPPQKSAPGDSPTAAEQHPEALAKQKYEQGMVEEAARLLEDLLKANPASPGAFLMLRICRELGDLPRAQAVVHDIAARGALTWRHHVELARTALAPRCFHPEIARRELHRARQAGAKTTWLAPLEQQLQEALSPDAGDGEDPSDASPSPVGSVTIAEISDTGTDIRGTVRRLLQSGSPLPSDQQREHLIRQVQTTRDRNVVVDLAKWLQQSGRPADAVRVLEDCLEWTAPERRPRLILQRDAAARAAGIPRSRLKFAPPPPVWEASPPSPELARTVHTHHKPITGPPASIPSIARAAALSEMEGADPSEVADLWTAAADDHPVAVSSALAWLVKAGREEEALVFYSERSEKLWLNAGASWNLGCAFAATGRPVEAVDAFEYHFAVTSRPLDPASAEALEPLFALVDRPLPRRPAWTAARPGVPHPAAPAQALMSAEAEAAKRIAKCRSAPDSHSFRLACDAVRKAIRLGGSGAAGRYVATMHELHSLLDAPTPGTAAGLAMVLTAARREAQAWELLTEWIRRERAHPDLLAPAVSLARSLGKVDYLRSLLKEYEQPDSGLAFHLSMAKLAHAAQDRAAVLHHAGIALSLNPTCAEAAHLRGQAGWKIGRGDPSPADLRQQLADAGLPRPRILQMVRESYGSVVDGLRTAALARFHPAPDHTWLVRGLPAWARAEAAQVLRAAEDEEWELACDHARELLEKLPHHPALVRLAAGCMMNARRWEEARTVALLVGHRRNRRELLVHLECAQGRFTEAARLLADPPTWYATLDPLLAHAGLLAEQSMGNDPAEAARLLLFHARCMPVPHRTLPAAVAALLADRARRPDLVDEAVEALRSAPPSLDDLVDQALSADVPEALNNRGLVPLNQAQLRRVVDHLSHDPERLYRFLHAAPKRSGSPQARQAEQAERKLMLCELLTRQGLLRDAVMACQEAERQQAHPAEVRRRLDAVCEAAGLPPSTAQDLLGPAITGGRRSAPLPAATDELVSQTASLTDSPGLADHLEAVAAALRDHAAGLDRAVCDRLGRSWTEQLRLIRAGSADSSDPAGDRVFAAQAAVIHGERLCQQLSAFPLQNAAVKVQKVLQELWNAAGREALRQGRTASRRLQVRPELVSRIEGGPVELHLAVQAGREAVQHVTARVRGGPRPRPEQSIGDLAPGETRSCFLVVASDAPRITVEVEGFSAESGEARSNRREVRVKQVSGSESVLSRFRPGHPVDPGMFVGRSAELERIRSTYQDAPRAAVPALFMTGSRRAGKTSIIHRLLQLRGGSRDELLPPEKWRIPHVFPVLLDGQDVRPDSERLLTRIAQEVNDRVEAVYGFDSSRPPVPSAPNTVDFRRWWRALRHHTWPGHEDIGLLLIIDEFQELLHRYRAGEELGYALGELRALKQRGEMALLFSGSCTTEELRAAMADTLAQQDFSQPMRIGPLDRPSTLEAVHQGFPEASVTVLPEAAERVYEVTRGHPQHVHMIGKHLAELLTHRRRRVVDEQLVDEARDLVSQEDEAVRSIIDPYAHGSGIPPLLFRIAVELTGSSGLTFRELQQKLLNSDEVKQLHGYIDYGLLIRNREQKYTWANPIIEDWFAQKLESSARSSENRDHEYFLTVSGFQIRQRFTDSSRRACVVQRPGSGTDYVARYYPEESRDVLRRVVNLMESLRDRPPVTGVPTRWSVHEQWLVHEKAPGQSLEQLVRHRRRITADRAVQWVRDAAVTLARVWDSCRMTHGDVNLRNLIVDEDGNRVHVVGWGHGAVREGDGKWSLLLRPRPSPYYQPVCPDHQPRQQRGDAFALACVLYQLLHPEHRPPWSPEGELRWRDLTLPGTSQGLSATVTQALAPERLRPGSPEEFADQLKEFLPQPAATPQNPLRVEFHNLNSMESTVSNESYSNSGSMTNSALGKHNTVSGNTSHAQSSTDDLIARLRSELDRLGDELRAPDRANIDLMLEDLAAESGGENPDPGRLKRTLAMIRNVLETVSSAQPALQIVGELGSRLVG